MNSEITPEATYRNRRVFLKSSIWAGSMLATGGLYRAFAPRSQAKNDGAALATVTEAEGEFRLPALGPEDAANRFEDIAGYNNYYEFSTDKTGVVENAAKFVTKPWAVEVGGLVDRPMTFSMDDLLKLDQVERTYRFRCVEGWSMVIPWVGFPLQALLKKVQPQSRAAYVAFESFYEVKKMPNSIFAGIDLPYVEGLRLDEAMHPLTLLATGLYGKTLPNQNGAPIRLVVPWKYGFKGAKAIVKITLTEKQPPTTWNIANPSEYGFYSNVNPAVDHPRWSQASERRIGEDRRRPTLPFNGYADQVASLYKDMDLRKFF